MDELELPKERLATTDASGKRVYLYPIDVHGKFKFAKAWVHGILLIFFLVLPWIKLNGQQILLLNLAERRFAIFGLQLWAHDTPLLFFLLLSFALAIAFVTAIFGRVWCGWACPQTVFIESVFRRIERWVEGPARDRRALDSGPWTSDKLAKKGIKWFAFLLASAIITHSFLAYFVGSENVLAMIRRPPTENWGSFLVVLGTTAIILFDFGWFREQFCVVMCPYGRFQSVLMDNNSLVVGYDAKRGEPRRQIKVPSSSVGDCVNCFKCVQACPTGIDIRRGIQMECIACTACIDACDEVMVKTKKPQGLIRYTTLEALQGKPTQWLRPRVIAYIVLLSVVSSAFLYALSQTKTFALTVLRATDFPYQEVPSADGSSTLVVNHFRADLANQQELRSTASFYLGHEEKAQGYEMIIPINDVSLETGQARRVDFFIRFPKNKLKFGRDTLAIYLMVDTLKEPLKEELQLVGPVQ